jgi:hypothetical protein
MLHTERKIKRFRLQVGQQERKSSVAGGLKFLLPLLLSYCCMLSTSPWLALLVLLMSMVACSRCACGGAKCMMDALSMFSEGVGEADWPGSKAKPPVLGAE